MNQLTSSPATTVYGALGATLITTGVNGGQPTTLAVGGILMIVSAIIEIVKIISAAKK